MAARLALIAAFICASSQELNDCSCSIAEFDASKDATNNKCCNEDVTATTDKMKFWDKVWSIVGLNSEYHTVKIRRNGFDWSHLPKFCENEKNVYKEDSVMWCGGCTDHLVSDPRAKAALLYDSKRQKAPAYKREANGKTSQEGLVYVFSLGSRIPAVLCDRGVLQCICEDHAQEWAEFEPTCVRGRNCSARSETMYEEGASPGSIAPTQDQAESAPECTSPTHPRALIGGAFCEDMEVSQCEHAYSRSHGGHYHRCKIEPDAFRRTQALLMSKSEAQALADEARSWAIQNFYAPNLPWKVETKDFTTSILEEEVPAEAFEEAVRARMKQQAHAHPQRGKFMKWSTESQGTWAVQQGIPTYGRVSSDESTSEATK